MTMRVARPPRTTASARSFCGLERDESSMREPAHTHWQYWRVKRTLSPKESADRASDIPPAIADRINNRPLVPANPADERPGPDGIRWGLVERIRAEIAAGTYPNDEIWQLAQERMLEQSETAD